ncbi:MAG TPA: lectin-like protein [Phycisphaerae bacterium]|nr:lectin-like protein [Phycisphaerae bacterium]
MSSRSRCSRVLFLAAIISCCGTGISRADISYPDFSSIDGLTLNGNAAQSDNILRVVPDAEGQSGSAWFTAVKTHVVEGFDTRFTYQMWNSPDFPAGADGLAFLIQNDSENSLGSGGSGLGFEGIPASIAIKFDTFGFDEEPDNYISVQSLGLAPNSAEFSDSLGYVVPDTDLNDGNPHDVRIRYVPGTLDIYLDDLNTPILTVAIDLGNINGDNILDESGDAWVGFTAGTGLFYQIHDVLSWSLIEGQFCDCQNAIVINENNFSDETTIGAQPCHGPTCGKISGFTPGNIYAITPTQGGTELINTYNNTDFDTFITVHSGCPLTQDNQIQCNEDGSNFGAQVFFCAEAGHTYYVRVAGVGGGTGNFGLLAILFTAQIIDGPFQNPGNGHWYYSSGNGPWTASEQLGIAKGGHLASINSAAENEWVRSNFASITGQVAIGINDAANHGTYVWSSGEPVTYTNWQPGQPDNSGDHDYGVLHDSGEWNTQTNCSAGIGQCVIEVNTVPLPGILAGPINNPGNCHDYYLTEGATWIEAEMKAQAMGGHLVSINDAVENEFVRTNFANYQSQQQPVWIGFTDQAVEGAFVWTDGSPVTYTNWSPGEPNDLGNEDYGLMSDAVTGGWNDAHSGGPFYGVIELPAANCPCQCRGDMNGDLHLSGLDVQKFVNCLISAGGGAPPAGCGCADLDHNGALTTGDVGPMVSALLAGPGCAP